MQRADPLLAEFGWVLEQAVGPGRAHGLPFLLGPDGRPDDRVNSFFGSARMRARSPLTWKKYAHSLGLWLNFLLALGKRWDEATDEEAAYFKEWRLTEQSNPARVNGTTFAGDVAALRAFYRWAARRWAVVDPVAASDGFDLRPRGVREQDVKWLDRRVPAVAGSGPALSTRWGVHDHHGGKRVWAQLRPHPTS